ncbi:MAG: hypothetical protein LLF76_00220 [Planctomycetaceae bacterium]|nr:hypothetical protein [Planctomycetaceae bacterium]
MSTQKLLKRIHVCGTLWFLLCAAALLILSLRQAGFRWWIVFSISGYSAVLVLFLFTIYLFAVYQGVVRNQNPVEHPLTTSSSYIALYDIAPFLGSLSGLLAAGQLSWLALLNAAAQGALVTTFIMWIVIDPLIGLIESLLPRSIASRRQRIRMQHAQKLRIRRDNEELLVRLEQQEARFKAEWASVFGPYAKEAAALLCTDDLNEKTQRRLVELGAMAWQQGQFICMQYFHEMILREIRNRPQRPSVDFAALWWDGIGVWRRPEISSLILEPLDRKTDPPLLLRQS